MLNLFAGRSKCLVGQIRVGEMVGRSDGDRSNEHFIIHRPNGWSEKMSVGET